MQLNKGLTPRVPGKAPRTLTSLLTCLGATSGGWGESKGAQNRPRSRWKGAPPDPKGLGKVGFGLELCNTPH